ncbi:MAG: ATP-dependent DNA helicase RecG [Clostridia bacterium]|nr:ATP-dependent DNA helicase RecG [Clostridia bacterium]
MALELGSDVRMIRGIGDKSAKALEKLGIKTCRDLLNHYPRGYEDRTRIVPVAELSEEINQVAEVTVTSPVRKVRLRSGKVLIQAEAADDSGSVMLNFFNQEYMKNVLVQGGEYYVFGRVSGGRFAKDMTNPEVRKKDGEFEGEILPVYPLTEGIRQNDLRKAVRAVLSDTLDAVTDALPVPVRKEYELATVRFSLQNIHFPDSEKALEVARKRLIFGEFFTLAAALAMRKNLRRGKSTAAMDVSSREEFEKSLPFSLTGAQRRAVDEILGDLSSGSVMNRLVQGDVGSGKTAVAAMAAFVAIRNRKQAAVMAPTEILAAQHDETFRRFFAPFGIRTALLTSSTKASERREILQGLESGEISFVSGTHALLEESVHIPELALVICDEQHRFGVEQRTRLAQKGSEVHTLVMSATPIPRTLALVMYGDLEVSIIDELPPGREPVKTYLIGEEHREGLYGFIRKTVKEGRQAYIVCPLVEENEALELASAEAYTEELRTKVFPDLRIGLLHGRMKAKEKNEIMEAFAAREIDILVSTTVIEVGIDVPNAALMAVENAERFGLSQLHQLRGRVGRGRDKAFCFLLSEAKGEARARLKVMTSTNDGFKVAEEDLALRGPGDFFGKRQHGLPEMRIASFSEDVKTLKTAQNAAAKLLAEDPMLEKEENRLLKKAVKSLDDRLEENR